jgi:4-oxalocrotonate tautomerase
MPLTHISLREGTSEEYRQAIFESVYQAMRETFNVPENDQFMTISEHGAANFRFGANYLGIERSDKLVLIQITANNTRTVEQKKALFARIVERLQDEPGLRPEDVFINLVEVVKENWSFGNGIAQYA